MLRQEDCNMDDPEQFAAWAFAAGIPDARGSQYQNQPMVPAVCFAALSKMLWDLGFRHVPEDQTAWVKPSSGPDMNFQAWGVTDIKPVVEALLDIAPEKAAAVAAVTPETHQAALQDATAKMLESIERLRAATAAHGEITSASNGGGAAV